MRIRSIHLALASAVLATLVSCGGGGGSGSGSTSPGSGSSGGGSSATGLVPAAPSVGAVIAADATQFRVLRAGATWSYRGFDQLDGQSANGTVYADVVTHAAASGGTAEMLSNGNNEGSDTSVIVSAAGVVKTTVTIDPTGLGKPETFDDVELRSPVRIDDQYTVYDRHFDNGGSDFDGDGINDALDVAAWRRVVGTEVLDLHHRRQVSTVRVDETLRLRVRYSRDGSYSSVIEIVQSTWYAAGIGIVRVRSDRPNQNVSSLRHITTEELLTWDGLSAGVGPLPPQAAALTAPATSSGAIAAIVEDASAFDDHVVVASSMVDTPTALGFALTSIDPRGRLLATRNYTPSAWSAGFLAPQQLLRLGSELRLVALIDNRLSMLSFDASGQLPLSAPVILTSDAVYGFDSVYARAAAGGSRFWLVWLATYNVGTTQVADLKVQGFDVAGVPATTAVVLEQAINPTTISNVRIATSAADPVLVSWTYSGASGGEGRYAAINASTGALLARRTGTQTGYPLDNLVLEPSASGPGLTLNSALDPASGVIVGVLLGAGYDPMRSSTASFASEIVSPRWLRPVQGFVARPVGSFGHLFEYVGLLAPQFAQDTLPVLQPTLVEVISSSTLAGSEVRLLARLPFAAAATYASQGVLQVPITDRVLIVSGVGASLSTTPVWRVP